MNWLRLGAFVCFCAIPLAACPAEHPDDGGGSNDDGDVACGALDDAVAEARDAIVSCEADDECGQPLMGTSCGCTRDLVAREDADPTAFYEALSEAQAAGCDTSGSTCDCPEADGFVCNDGRCGWNYVDAVECSHVEIGQLCVRGSIEDDEEILEEGAPLRIQVFPKGCFSSSCTRIDVAACSVQVGDDLHEAQAEFCLAGVGQECTADCGGGGSAECSSDSGLTKGEHTVTLGDLTLEITVPGTLPLGGLCDGEAL
jgi:hypothetical protein